MNSKATRKTVLEVIPQMVLCALAFATCTTGGAEAQDWEFSLTWGRAGTAPGEFLHPMDVEVDLDGLIYVADSGNSRIQVFTETGEFVREWRGSGYRTIRSPRGIAIDGEFVYTLSAVNCSVQKWTRTGDYVDRFVDCDGPAGLEQARGVAARNGAVYVAANGGVRMFTEDLEFIGNIGEGVINWFDVEVAADGTLWCSAPFQGLMRQYNTSGVVLAEWSTMLPGETSTNPRGVSLTSAGNVIVVDVPQAWLGRFSEFRPDGSLVEVAYNFIHPYTAGICTVGDNTVYVVSTSTDQVVKHIRVPAAVGTTTWGGIKATYRR